jgi:hypothetical protein
MNNQEGDQGSTDARNQDVEMVLETGSRESELTVRRANTGNSLNGPPGRTATAPSQAENSMNSTPNGSTHPSNQDANMVLETGSRESEHTVQRANTGNSLNGPEEEEPGRTGTASSQAENSMNSTPSVSVGISLVEDLFGSLDIEGSSTEGTISPLTVIDRIKSLEADHVTGDVSKVSSVFEVS